MPFVLVQIVPLLVSIVVFCRCICERVAIQDTLIAVIQVFTGYFKGAHALY